MGPLPDPETQRHQPFPVENRPVGLNGDVTQPRQAAQMPLGTVEQFQEPAYSEHVSGSLVVSPSEAQNFRPAYQPYQGSYQIPMPQQGNPYQTPPRYQGNGQAPVHPIYQPYAGTNGAPTRQYQPFPPAPNSAYPGYYGYPPPYGYPYPPAAPKRNGYQLGVSIASFVGAILVFLAGLGCTLLLLLISIVPSNGTGVSQAQQFSGIVTFTAFVLAGLIGGGFTLYHSARALFMNRPSAQFKLPWFWIFLVLYIVVLAIAAWLNSNGQSVANIPTTIFLIVLAGMLPALTILALGLRRIHYPSDAKWPTTWRRFALAIVSGATSAVLLAAIFELILTAFATQQLGVTRFSLDNPDLPIPQDAKALTLLLIIVSVIAPLVEEAVKPLAVVVLIGRVQSAAEAFVLGLACGIGFDLIETSGYISMGYNDWLNVALQRSTAGLLHGFGAGMVALGWYYITHPKSTRHHVLLAVGCWTYAVLQHAIWNGSFVLQLLPSPIGPYLTNGTIPIGNLSMPAFLLVYIGFSILMLVFFLFITGKLRGKKIPKKPGSLSDRPGLPLTYEMPIGARV